MFDPNNQFPIQPMALSVHDPLAPMQVDQNENSLVAEDEIQNGRLSQAKSIIQSSERLQDDLRLLGLKIKQHEDNLKLITSQKNKLEESILDMQVILGKYHSSTVPKTENEDHSHLESVQKIIENILKHEKSAARIICQLKSHQGTHASHLKLIKDVLGVVATLGKVDDENLSKLLAQYLGLETMLAIVCKTYEGVKALEICGKDGCIDKSAGLHGLAASLGKPLDSRFLVICLENLRPFAGDFAADDPQKRLDLLKPRLPSGECPPGFLGFAVNMIKVDSSNLFHVTVGGEGAVSLDGGIIRSNGMFALGSREEVDVRFPKPSLTPNVPQSHIQAEKQVKEMNMKKENLQEDIKREQALLDKAKLNFQRKKEEFVKFIAESSSYAYQHQFQVARDRLTPR
ncbi:hypothetical protein SLA2020_362020 [Shorea laevis]